jgi:hypothetical protein
MSIPEERYINLTVENELIVNDISISGNLNIQLNKLHTQNHGVFTSNIDVGDYNYVIDLHSDGMYVDLFTRNKTNLESTTRIVEKTTQTNSIKYTDMHYEHVLNDQYFFKFMSDMKTILLTNVTNGNSVFLHKNTDSNRGLKKKLTFRKI